MPKSLAIGAQGENQLIQVFEQFGIEATKNEDKATREFWDVDCKLGKTKFKVEVKYDWMAQKTGNIAIEYYNSKSCKPSGIEVTKAKIWCHVLQDGSHKTIWLGSVKGMKAFIKQNDPWKNLIGVGDNNACLYLYRESDLLDIVLHRIDVLEQKKAHALIRKLLK